LSSDLRIDLTPDVAAVTVSRNATWGRLNESVYWQNIISNRNTFSRQLRTDGQGPILKALPFQRTCGNVGLSAVHKRRRRQKFIYKVVVYLHTVCAIKSKRFVFNTQDYSFSVVLSKIRRYIFFFKNHSNIVENL
jgi:hypothetical protein